MEDFMRINDLIALTPFAPEDKPNMIRYLNDAAGQMVGQWQVQTGMQQMRLDLGDFPGGVYWVQWKSARGTAVQRVVKQ